MLAMTTCLANVVMTYWTAELGMIGFMVVRA